MKVKVLAPATVANLGPGFDILGLSLTHLADEIIVSKINSPTVKISSKSKMPLDPEKNTAGRGLLKLIKDKNLSFGFLVEINKKIPLCSGLGGSASCASGSILGANELLETKLTKKEILHYALEGEGATGSFHMDNIAPCLLGGIVCVLNKGEVSLITKSSFKILIVHQNIEINTHESRKLLPKEVSLSQHIKQSQNLTSLILGLKDNNLDLIKKGLEDVLVEPQRSKLIPHYEKIKKELLPLTIGGSISGSGPSLFFLYEDEKEEQIKDKVKDLEKNIDLNIYFDEVNTTPLMEQIHEISKH